MKTSKTWEPINCSDYCLVECDALCFGRELPAFWAKLLLLF